MNNIWYPLLALFPIILIFLLLVVRQWPAQRGMPTAFATTWLIAVIWWKSPFGSGRIIRKRRNNYAPGFDAVDILLISSWNFGIDYYSIILK